MGARNRDFAPPDTSTHNAQKIVICQYVWQIRRGLSILVATTCRGLSIQTASVKRQAATVGRKA